MDFPSQGFSHQKEHTNVEGPALYLVWVRTKTKDCDILWQWIFIQHRLVTYKITCKLLFFKSWESFVSLPAFTQGRSKFTKRMEFLPLDNEHFRRTLLPPGWPFSSVQKWAHHPKQNTHTWLFFEWNCKHFPSVSHFAQSKGQCNVQDYVSNFLVLYSALTGKDNSKVTWISQSWLD